MQVNFEVFKQGLRYIYKQEEFTSEPFPASPFYPSDSHFDLLRLLSQSPYEQPGINEGVHSAPSRASVDSICLLYRTKDLPYRESHIRFV